MLSPVTYLLFTYSAHFLLCNNALHLLMQDPLLLDLKKNREGKKKASWLKKQCHTTAPF